MTVENLPKELFNELVNGLTLLLALRLPGAPADDTIQATALAWEVALNENKQWDAERDKARFATGFRRLAAESQYWPMPVALIHVLPPPPEPLMIEYRHQKPSAEQLRRKDEIVSALAHTLAEKSAALAATKRPSLYQQFLNRRQQLAESEKKERNHNGSS